MGNESSQLVRDGDSPNNARPTAIGPSMTPTPEPEDHHTTQADRDRAAASPLPIDTGPDPDGQPSKKTKKKKRRKSSETDAAALVAGPSGPGEVADQEPAKTSKNKKSKKEEIEPQTAEDAMLGNTQFGPQMDEVEEPQSLLNRKQKRAKAHAARDSHLPLLNGTHLDGSVDGDNTPLHPSASLQDGTQLESTPLHGLPVDLSQVSGSSRSAKKKKKRRKEAGDASSSNNPQALFAHGERGSPPSAQPPEVGRILKYEPLREDDDDDDDVEVIPFSQGELPRREGSQSLDRSQSEVESSDSEIDMQALEASQLKRESSDSDNDIDELLQSQFAGIAAENFAATVTNPVAEAMREHDPENGLGWLHKREHTPQETPIMDHRTALQRSVDASLPDLQPSQVKTEPHSDSENDNSTESSASSDLDSHSPSAQKSARLSRSRSRSASRGPIRSGFLADQALGLSAAARPDPYGQVPYSSPSSTGSNLSIPARLPSPSSTGSNRSIPAHMEPEPTPPGSASGRSQHLTGANGNDPLARGDAMDLDSEVAQESASRKRGKEATTAKPKNTAQPQPDEVDAVDGEAVARADAVVTGRKEALVNGDAMDVDESLVEAIPSPQANALQRITRSHKKKAVAHATQPEEADVLNHNDEAADVDAATEAVKPKKQNRKRQGDDSMADRNVRVMANWLGGSVNGEQHPEMETAVQNGAMDDELPLGDMPAAEEAQPVASVSQPRRSQRRRSKTSLIHEVEAALPVEAAPTAPEAADEGQDASPEPAAEARDASIEPGQQACQSQPTRKSKGKKKRMLGQPKASLSLSQIEGDEVEEDFSAVFARRTSTKQLASGGVSELNQSQAGPSQQAAPSQAPSPDKPRKIKRKRRAANAASEDEMESILAAGPSKGRKRVIELGPSDNEDVHEAKRKRLSSAGSGKASGAWVQNELNALGKVVEDYRDEHGMTQHEINQLIQEVPNKSDPLNKDFWDRADIAVPRRTRKQITERARRMYHNFAARGTWTEAQKEELHDLFESHPKKFGEIARIINRHQQDVRDYWRNQYLVFESQIKSRWSQEEEERLKEVVEEALGKIQIERENNDQFRPRPRTKRADDEALLDWQVVSATMNFTRSRQQCKWKWTDMREKGLMGGDSIRLPTQPRSSAGPSGSMRNGISEELANAREDFRGMGPEEKFRLIDAIKDSGAREYKQIVWRSLVDERFRLKWHRPSLRLVWYRLRQTVPDYEKQDVEANARHLVNYYHMHQSLPRFDDNKADDAAEEQVVHYVRGKRVWKRPSGNPRAVRERQRRSSSVSSRASSRLSHRVSSEILNLSDEEEAPRSGSRQSLELGEDRGRPGRRTGGLRSDDLEVSIPGHLKGEAAQKALEQARAKAKRKGKARAMYLGGEKEKQAGGRSNSVAVDSESE